MIPRSLAPSPLVSSDLEKTVLASDFESTEHLSAKRHKNNPEGDDKTLGLFSQIVRREPSEKPSHCLVDKVTPLGGPQREEIDTRVHSVTGSRLPALPFSASTGAPLPIVCPPFMGMPFQKYHPSSYQSLALRSSSLISEEVKPNSSSKERHRAEALNFLLSNRPEGQGSIDGLFYLAKMLRKQNQLNPAAENFKELSNRPECQKMVKVFAAYAETLRLQNKIEEALTQLKKAFALPEGSQHVTALTCYAHILCQQGKVREAHALLLFGAKRQPRPEKAALLLQKALELPGCQENVEILFLHSLKLFDQKKFKEALLGFNQALRRPCSQDLKIKILNHLAATFHMLGDLKAAEQEYQKLVVLPENQKEASIFFTYSKVLAQLGKFEEAVLQMQKYFALSGGKQDREAWNTYNCFLVYAGKVEEARVQWQEFLTTPDGMSKAYRCHYAAVLLQLGHVQHAEQEFIRFFTENPDCKSVQPRALYAETQYQLGNSTKATEVYLCPGKPIEILSHEDRYFDLVGAADQLFLRNQFDLAWKCLEEARQVYCSTPYKSVVYATRFALILHQLRQTKKAQEFLKDIFTLPGGAQYEFAQKMYKLLEQVKTEK